MQIRKISKGDVRGFIDCYVEIWESLKGILPEEYVNDQIEKASGNIFQDDLLSKTSDPVSIFLVAEVGTETIGLAWGNIRKYGSSWLSFLGVSPDHRRKGVGKSLLTRFIEESKKKGSRKIRLDTDPRLIPALKLYENMGFIPEGITKNPYGLELIIYGKVIE
ncbi:MAG: GNAT family N-acetyltransferase [Candidatus Bathyarchaeota archaeon]|nr:MAG: GNAT family N-acetyltransferase [Candidatus Bathyarchaeota archaeon]